MAIFGVAIAIGTTAHLKPALNRRRQTYGYLAIRGLMTALDRYKTDCEQYPSSAEALDALVHNPGATCWKGPYIEGDIPQDPWRRAYIYRSDNSQPEIISYGADGKPGGEFFDMDLSSRHMWRPSPQAPEEIRTRLLWIASWYGACFGFLTCAWLLYRT